jgi:ATP-dependent RNA helicase DeaD
MPRKVAQLAHKYMAHPREIEVGRTTPESAEHYRVDVNSARKLAALLALVEKERPAVALVFARTRDGVQLLARDIESAGVSARGFHGDLDQIQRERVVADLKEGRAHLVVATDVAARGLDIQGITHVINYDVPEEAETYVHRAGRTARAGKSGRVFSLVTENDGALVVAAERAAKLKLRPFGLTILEDGVEIQLTKETMTPPKPEMRGGNARGARRKNAPTPPKPVKLTELPEETVREHEFRLPPSRRERKEP